MTGPRLLIPIILLLLFVSLPLGSRGSSSDEAQPYAALDRIEEGMAVMVLEEGASFALPVSLLPAYVNEGDCIGFTVAKDEAKHSSIEKSAASMLEALQVEPR